MTANNTDTTGVLARAAAILDAVEASPQTTSDLANRLGLSASTVYRLVGDMAKHSMLRRGDGGLLHPGDRFGTSSLVDLSVPILRRVREDTGESAQLWVVRGSNRLCLVSEDSRQELRASLPAGALLPLGAGSAGHVLAGDFDADEESRERGWWESRSERTPGLTSVSAPVRRDGRIVAAVCVAGPIERVPTTAGLLWGQAVCDAASEIEQSLVVRPEW
ncbi:helix-turn-helix domain-containing protein [Rhodococcoides fascians A21d2]|uniref:IclR family transcriptional regulator n=1 Tax=Nocardiaceae TaxID=85025 RepID=UPI00056065F9|nr:MULTISPECIES: helix-turn-helix domain-containing protein [Rhodococcus]OZC48837.1 ArsR family transcriptional regulator [Rhodococcus sp. WWJCD1]OZC58083.1 ArsR family transcriptional regulator [Rhodococcus sp. 06-470-2]OZE55095.1 ArsR family transcriptional regulator [Rhodococcus sp. 05-2221-1B]OZE81275.1 ArsR family transcriptional regulator [Rhodococcus sp. 15-649-2-2]QIH98536.1 helix-turn-helix domain-containing protein [Rhodococcus fascians A21d2]